jgi:hypothetical protein
VTPLVNVYREGAKGAKLREEEIGFRESFA